MRVVCHSARLAGRISRPMGVPGSYSLRQRQSVCSTIRLPYTLAVLICRSLSPLRPDAAGSGLLGLEFFLVVSPGPVPLYLYCHISSRQSKVSVYQMRRQYRFSLAQDQQPEVGDLVRLRPVQPKIRPC
jgi:hypothetical protein